MRLLQPFVVRGVTLRNRVVMAPMTTRLAAEDGTVTEELLAYYEARAAGGVGIVTVELCSPDPGGRHRRREVGAFDDRFLPGLRHLVERVKRHGACISIQLGHAGAHARPDVTGVPAVAPSAVPHPVQEGDHQMVVPRPLTRGEIAAVVEAYGRAAARMRAAGFDAIEVQGAHDYLIAQFLSPLDNQRGDEYGGDLQGRARFAVEVVRECRAVVGDMPISFRMNGDEFAPGGFGLGDACAVAPLLEKAGVDILHVSGGSHRSRPCAVITCAPMAYPDGVFLTQAAAVKHATRLPVIAVGRLHDPQLAEQALTGGSADLIALGRALLADPEWPKKVAEGRMADIRPCLACNTCVMELRSGRPVGCLINPACAHETDLSRSPAPVPRRLVVVGGGPAGLNAALRLAERGHEVALHDAAEQWGGQLRLAALAPVFQEVECAPERLTGYIAYLERMAKAVGVRMHLGSRIRSDALSPVKVDAVILALGAPYRRPWRWLFPWLLRTGWARRWPFSVVAARPWVQDWLLTRSRRAEPGMALAMRASGLEVREIGDGVLPRGTLESIREAWRTARDLN
jgi:2,4-dienoyl-CoA reductase-like NADH-dependent reductase (Old Yellow Enzyme family)